jgi:hypothetical protein
MHLHAQDGVGNERRARAVVVDAASSMKLDGAGTGGLIFASTSPDCMST